MEKLLRKYFKGGLRDEELQALTQRLKDVESREQFKVMVRKEYRKHLFEQEFDMEQEFADLCDKLKRPAVFTKRFIQYAAAASVALVLGLSGYFVSALPGEDDGEQKFREGITLTLGDGEVRQISEHGEEDIQVSQNGVLTKRIGTVLDYSEVGGEAHQGENVPIVYNELQVPYGKTFQLALSDGTTVHINAGTTIKYPTRFAASGQREVYLDGEAFFDVHTDKARPFVVHATGADVRVFGTQFNVNSYAEDGQMQTVLVEGSVGMYTLDDVQQKEAVMLKPGQLGVLTAGGDNFDVQDVDVTEFTAWTRGHLQFKVRPFSEIIKVLERHYDVQINNSYQELGDQRFFAKFDIETIEEVLQSFQKSQPFRYQMEGDSITIDEPKQ